MGNYKFGNGYNTFVDHNDIGLNSSPEKKFDEEMERHNENVSQEEERHQIRLWEIYRQAYNNTTEVIPGIQKKVDIYENVRKDLRSTIVEIINSISSKQRFTIKEADITVRDGDIYIFNSSDLAHLEDISSTDFFESLKENLTNDELKEAVNILENGLESVLTDEIGLDYSQNPRQDKYGIPYIIEKGEKKDIMYFTRDEYSLYVLDSTYDNEKVIECVSSFAYSSKYTKLSLPEENSISVNELEEIIENHKMGRSLLGKIAPLLNTKIEEYNELNKKLTKEFKTAIVSSRLQD